jgi:hypothetical protein
MERPCLVPRGSEPSFRNSLFISFLLQFFSGVVSGTEQKNSTCLFLPWMSEKATKGPHTCDGLRLDGDRLTPVMSAVYQPINVPPAGAQAFLMDLLHIRRTGYNPPRGPSAG